MKNEQINRRNRAERPSHADLLSFLSIREGRKERFL